MVNSMSTVQQYQLRDYQVRALAELDAWFEENETGHPIVHAATGSGKSILIAEFCRRAVLDYPGYRARILMLVPSLELLKQNYEKIMPLASDLKIGIISASAGRKDMAIDKDVVIATVGSVVRNPGNLGRMDIILCDESHLISRKNNGTYRKLIADCQRYNPILRTIGFTASPFRGDGIWLTEGEDRLFTDIATRITMRELLDKGYLSPLVTVSTGIQIDASDVKMKQGDFVIYDLVKRIDKQELTDQIASQIVELGKNRKKWLVYCVTIEHAQHMRDAICKHGIKAEVVSSKTPAVERQKHLDYLKAGRIRCLCNVACLTTGIDIPDLDLIALVRNTRSPVLLLQIAGRGVRTAPEKTNCAWLDFTDTTEVMGPVDRITGRLEPKPRDVEIDAPFKICPECGSSLATATRVCKCGYEFPEPSLNLNAIASSANIITRVTVNTYPVTRVEYSQHINRKNPEAKPTLKVSYFSSYRLICSEWVCLEHEGFAGIKAKLWWRERFSSPMDIAPPKTVKEALAKTEWLRTPDSIVVREGGNWPELIKCLFEREAA